jgi:hypothetical protein
VAVVTVDTGAVELQAAAVTCYVKAAHDPHVGMKIVRKKSPTYWGLRKRVGTIRVQSSQYKGHVEEVFPPPL